MTLKWGNSSSTIGLAVRGGRRNRRFNNLTIPVRALLESKGRVAYRALNRRFDLDDEYIEDFKAELIGHDFHLTSENIRARVGKSFFGRSMQ